MYTPVCTLLDCPFSAVKKSEPLSRRTYVISVEALPCSAPNRSRLTCSGSPSPIISHGRGAGGEGGHGDLGLRRFGAGGVAGMCGERACSMCVCAGLRAVRSRLAGRVSGAAGRLRTGMCTLWCPLAQQFRTPLCILVHLAQAGNPC